MFALELETLGFLGDSFSHKLQYFNIQNVLCVIFAHSHLLDNRMSER